MTQQVNARRLLVTQITCGMFATMLTIWSAGLFVLAAAIPVVRPERVGFGILAGVGAVSLWIVFVGIVRMQRIPSSVDRARAQRRRYAKRF